MSTTSDVIIIGAGFSGLYAALKLYEQGMTNFKILEAQERIGGRVQSAAIDTHLTVDLGAQWICSKQSRITALIKKMNLETVHSDHTGKNIYEFLNKRTMKKGSIPPVPFLGLYELWKIRKTYKKLLKQIPSDCPWDEAISTELDLFSFESWINEHIKNDAGRAYYKMIAKEGACTNLDEMSFFDILWGMKSAGSFENIRSAEEKWLKDGAQIIADKMAEPFSEKIVLNSPVRSIDYREDLVAVNTEKQVYPTKRVIITVPIHLINKIEFKPELPQEKSILFDQLPKSFVIKTIIVYETPFWREQGLSGNFYADHSLIQLTVDTTAEKSRYGILTIFTTGSSAKALGKLAYAERKDQILTKLETIFGEKGKRPLYYQEKDWNREQWIDGGYGSHFPTGILAKYGSHLSKNIGPLHWAGTETATEWRLYMEGALQSGERAAREVIESLQDQTGKLNY